MLLLVKLSVAQGKARFLFHPQHRGQLEIMALILMSAGLAHTDESASLQHKAADGGRNLWVFPPAAAGRAVSPSPTQMSTSRLLRRSGCFPISSKN